MGSIPDVLSNGGQADARRRFFDRSRRRVLRLLAAAWLAPAAWALAAGEAGVALALALPGVIALRMASLEVISSDDAVVAKAFFRNHVLRWDQISHFESKRFGLRDVAVPCVVLTNGRVMALHGLDSVLSGFGARSSMWEPTLRGLSERLNAKRYSTGSQGQ